MNREQFRVELAARLAAFTDMERAEVLDYYDEIVCDRMEEGQTEEDAVASLGDVAAIAAQAESELNAARRSGADSPVPVARQAEGLPARIEINLPNNRLYVFASPDDAVHVTYFNSPFRKFTYGEEGGTLYLRGKRRNVLQVLGSMFTFSEVWDRKPVTLAIPAGFCGDVDLYAGNGAIEIEGVAQMASLRCRDGNGHIGVRNLRVTRSAELNSSNGRVELTGVHCGGKLAVSSSNGRVEMTEVSGACVQARSSNGRVVMRRIRSEEVTARTSNGRIETELYGRQEDYRIDCHTSNGSILLGSLKLAGQIINETAPKRLTADTSNGRIEMRFIEG